RAFAARDQAVVVDEPLALQLDAALADLDEHVVGLHLAQRFDPVAGADLLRLGQLAELVRRLFPGPPPGQLAAPAGRWPPGGRRRRRLTGSPSPATRPAAGPRRRRRGTRRSAAPARGRTRPACAPGAGRSAWAARASPSGRT